MCGVAADWFRMQTIASQHRSPRCHRAPALARLLFRLAVAALALAASMPARAAPTCPEADVWVASTRRLPDVCRLPEQAGLDVERLSGGDCGRWERASVAELLAEPDRPLLVFIHGNRYAPAEAKSQGVRLARLVAATCPDAGPVRTLIFSWPSEQQGLMFRDVRGKYDRAHAEGHYLAWLLGQANPDQHVALVGYSFGALVALEALRDLVVAERDGDPAAETWSGRPGRTHLVFVAAAVRCDALAPRGPYRDSLAGVDRLTLVANSSDVALALFPHVDRCVGAEALGATGMPRRWVPVGVEYAAVDGADIVGRQHRLPLYFDSRSLVRRIAAGAVDGFGPPPAP